MSFTIKVRGGGLLAAEYMCLEHGRFDATVERDTNGDPPPAMPCPHEREDETTVYLCLRDSQHVISAPHPKVLSVPCTAEVRGGDMKDRPPGMLDTRPLAEGQKYSEWKKDQAKLSESRRYDELVRKGLATKRVQVG